MDILDLYERIQHLFLPNVLLRFRRYDSSYVHYSESLGWGWLNQIASVGAVMMGIGFLLLCYNVIWSARHGERDTTGDPWDGRTLEWATQSPVQHYNFAKLPEIKEADAFWYMKNAEKQLHQQQKTSNQFTCQVTLVCLLLRLDSSVLQVSH